jgi:hypothetical protein
VGRGGVFDRFGDIDFFQSSSVNASIGTLTRVARWTWRQRGFAQKRTEQPLQRECNPKEKRRGEPPRKLERKKRGLGPAMLSSGVAFRQPLMSDVGHVD